MDGLREANELNLLKIICVEIIIYMIIFINSLTLRPLEKHYATPNMVKNRLILLLDQRKQTITGRTLCKACRADTLAFEKINCRKRGAKGFVMAIGLT